MILSTQNFSQTRKDLNFNFWLSNFKENEVISLFQDAICNHSINTALNGWIQKAQTQVSSLEQLLYNSNHLCPTLYESVYNKISTYDSSISELNRSLLSNEVNLPIHGISLLKQLLELQQRIQNVFMYLHV
ncbi:hypothetical protein LX97_00028 [Nonlabens dokdonensis]|uniref:Uncharacterized protein n=2 Tax=Nonlabens dokdonensis TaxID=328515 RepID=L7W6D7_NONDD|nr:hypothetical protein [Nonlabens dokdonensis]AGC75321.1 hypothetical protein DDD_0194 [Nonlabens dokdonensis DSW-6]PZX43029.1 hypothetical protein LX97_00028 [Nonlabens dokdonensis]